VGIPVKSLRVLRCRLCGISGIALSCLISSNVGACARYQAEGDDGGGFAADVSFSSGNIGLGLCMLPSEPRLRRGAGIPYPGLTLFRFCNTISPNKGFRGATPLPGLKSVIDCEVKSSAVDLLERGLVSRDV
jgi:hypothetical protein